MFVEWHLHVRGADPASWLKGNCMRREWKERGKEKKKGKENRKEEEEKKEESGIPSENVKRASCQHQCWIRNHGTENFHLAAIILLPFFSRNGHKNHDQWIFLFLWFKDISSSQIPCSLRHTILESYERSGTRNLVLSWEMTPGAWDEKTSEEFL